MEGAKGSGEARGQITNGLNSQRGRSAARERLHEVEHWTEGVSGLRHPLERGRGREREVMRRARATPTGSRPAARASPEATKARRWSGWGSFCPQSIRTLPARADRERRSVANSGSRRANSRAKAFVCAKVAERIEVKIAWCSGVEDDARLLMAISDVLSDDRNAEGPACRAVRLRGARTAPCRTASIALERARAMAELPSGSALIIVRAKARENRAWTSS